MDEFRKYIVKKTVKFVFEVLYKNITRIEVIEYTGGRVYVNNNIKLNLISLQDEGRTMKLFIKSGERNEFKI